MPIKNRNRKMPAKREDSLWDRYMHLYTGDNRWPVPGIPSSVNSREDFKSKNSKRTFTIRLSGGECLYVNPYFFETMSIAFQKHFETVKDPYGEVVYDDLNVHDVHLLLSSVCPDLYHLYPTPIIMSYLPILLPLAKRLEMPKLLLCCENVLEEDLKQNNSGAEKLLTSFNYAFKFGFSLELQARLLQRILRGRFPKDMTDEDLFYERSGHVLALAYIQNLKKKFAHTGLKRVIPINDNDEEIANGQLIKLPRCLKCIEKSKWNNNRRKRTFIGDAVINCSACDQIFCTKCLKTPCTIMLVEFLKKYNSVSSKAEGAE